MVHGGVALALGSFKVLLQTAAAGGPRPPYGADLFVRGLVGQVRRPQVAAGGRVVDLDLVVVVGHEPDTDLDPGLAGHPRPHVVAPFEADAAGGQRAGPASSRVNVHRSAAGTSRSGVGSSCHA